MTNNEALPCVIIDSNAWNFLHNSGIELNSPLLIDYDFAITLEIKREMECLSGRDDKAELYNYFSRQMNFLGQEKVFFGFFDSEFDEDEQRSGGFGYGGFASVQERDFIEDNSHMIKQSKRGVYYGNEADLLIASRAGGTTYILTEDDSKNGPFKGVDNIINVSQANPMTQAEFQLYLKSSI
ncbi:hypothetical protein [[Curtobacterium] plantarum]|uniref:PIN domain-containing protein n=1 Tax=[Curtobacterium] plantarum TaxID=221276 RepID=A0ABT9T7E3_9GAMM|nr:hypothetical protein [[Curtobacterium] plantarum]MDQ0019055.1 hypothetical protein [[Curtobacterium] plantarum]